MNPNKVDQFYKDQLKDFEITPSADLWNKIDHKLERKKKPVALWFSVAASFLVLLALGSYVFNSTVNVTPQYQYIWSNKQPGFYNPETLESPEMQSVSQPVLTASTTQASRENAEEIKPRTLAFISDEGEFANNEIWPIDKIDFELKESNNSRTIVIADGSRYLKSKPKTQNYGNQLKNYTAAQWGNIKSGQSIETPPAPHFSLNQINIKKPKFLQSQL